MSAKTRKYPRRQLKLLISDNDGTLLSVHSWFGPAMLVAVPQVARALNVSVDEVGAEIGRNMIAHKALETGFPFVGDYFAQKWTGTHAEFVEHVTKPFFATVDEFHNRYARPFPGVLDAFEEAERVGAKVVMLSDAPLHSTLAKLTALGLNNLVAGVYSLETTFVQPDVVWNQLDYNFCAKRLESILALASGFSRAKIVSLPQSYEKPNTKGIEMILNDFAVKPDQCLMVGDSCVKDGGVAEAMGMRFAFARYGVNDYTPPQYMEVISSMLNPFRNSTMFWQHYAMPTNLPPIARELTTYAGVIPFLQAHRRKATSTKVA